MGISLVDGMRASKEIKTPAFFCKSCSSCVDNRCQFFGRHVIPNLNRCFNHTYYDPQTSAYITPEDLKGEFDA